MSERPNAVTMSGNPVTLIGDEVHVGDTAPPFTLTASDGSSKSLDDFAGKVKLLSVVPSIDTSVCANETRKFNEKAANLGDDVVVLTVSMDTPMAFKRWCAAEGIDKVVCMSDFKDHSFGMAYGVRMKEKGLLARQVMILDRDNKVIYKQLVKEVADEPDYDEVIAAAKAAV